MPLPFPVDADGDQHGPMDNHPILAHFLVTGIKDQVGIVLFQAPVGKPV